MAPGRDIKAPLGDVPDNSSWIWHCGFAGMFNNAIDHSEDEQTALREINANAEIKRMIRRIAPAT